MRQGCPIAAYHYILQAEPMAEAVRKNENIQGIEVPHHDLNTKQQVKILCFADDAQLFFKNVTSMEENTLK